MPDFLWIVLTLIGIVLYKHWEIVPFLFFSYIYTKKNSGYFASISPVSRGLQYFFLVAGITGYHNPLAWIALIAIFIRNFTGDLRDIVKDRNENMKTLPVVIGLKKDIPHIHLIALILTSTIWWGFTSLSLWTLLVVLLVELGSYNITPR